MKKIIPAVFIVLMIALVVTTWMKQHAMWQEQQSLKELSAAADHFTEEVKKITYDQPSTGRVNMNSRAGEIRTVEFTIDAQLADAETTSTNR